MDEWKYNNSKYEVSEEYMNVLQTIITDYPAYHRSTATGSIRKVNIVDTLDSADLGIDIAAQLRDLDIKVKSR